MSRTVIALSLVILALTSFAAPPEPRAAAEERIRSQLLEPLAAKERDQSRFSRARLPAQERRVRLLGDEPQLDARGAAFLSFALDARHGVRPGADAGWRLGTVEGCVYIDGKVFVQVGERHRPAAFLLGKNLKPVEAHVCKSASPTT